MKIMGERNGFMQQLDRLYPLIPPHDLQKYSRKFTHELIAALHNQRTSLPTILNPIYKAVPRPGFGVAVSIGGTNGYVSAFRIGKNGKITFFNREVFFLPVDTTKEKLFQQVTKHVLSVSRGKKRPFPIGIGMAYSLMPLCINGILDGELLYMSKGRNIDGLVGKKVGEEYKKYLAAKHKIDTVVTVANDAICLLLGGSGIEIAGVVGTGLNFAYWEKREKIAPMKLSSINNFSQKEVAVNTEAKNFDKIEGSILRKLVDEKSIDPGYSLAEKETAGAYLYQIFNAGKKELLGSGFPDLVSTDQLNDILTVGTKDTPVITSEVPPKAGWGGPERSRGDSFEVEILNKARLFADRIFHRSAQIVAIELCGILIKIGKTKGVVPVVMDGGLFWKAKNYPSLVNLYVNMILPEVIVSFARLFGSSRRGIAILAISCLNS